jgi:hypothetical protein
MFLATALVAVTMLVGMAAPSYWVMAALRGVAGIGAAGQTHTAALLSVEPVGPAYRCGVLCYAVLWCGVLCCTGKQQQLARRHGHGRCSLPCQLLSLSHWSDHVSSSERCTLSLDCLHIQFNLGVVLSPSRTRYGLLPCCRGLAAVLNALVFTVSPVPQVSFAVLTYPAIL